MKKLSITLAVFAALFMIAGCASNAPASNDSSVTAQQAQDAPDWFLNPPKDDNYIYGVGTCNASDLNRAKTLGDNRARVAVARTLQANVQDMITDYFKSSGKEGSEEVLNFSSDINQTLVDAKLKNVELDKAFVSKAGTYYALMRMAKSDAVDTAAAILESESAKYAEFKAEEARKLMQDQLKANKVTPAKVEE